MYSMFNCVYHKFKPNVGTLAIVAVFWGGDVKKKPIYPVILTKLFHKPLKFQDPKEPELNQADR